MLQDVTMLMKPERKCVQHDAPCELLESLEFFIAGFVCTSVSALNNSRSQNTTANETGKAGRAQ